MMARLATSLVCAPVKTAQVTRHCHAYLVLAESVWHASAVTTNLDIDSAEPAKELCDSFVQDLVRAGR